MNLRRNPNQSGEEDSGVLRAPWHHTRQRCRPPLQSPGLARAVPGERAPGPAQPPSEPALGLVGMRRAGFPRTALALQGQAVPPAPSELPFPA